MNTIEFLAALASTPAFQPDLQILIAKQPENIQNAFLRQDAQALKLLLEPRAHEILCHERTVSEF